MRAIAFLLVALLLAGCFGGEPDIRAGLVPYPRVGDVVVYEATGALIEFARWENGIRFAAPTAQVRLTVAASDDALDGARAVHSVFRVTTEVAEAGVFSKRSDRWISERHETVVQSFHPLSQDQSIVAFDERGSPWLFGASALIGEDLATRSEFSFAIPDELGRGQSISGAWRRAGDEDGLAKFTLELQGAQGALWMEQGVLWPARVELTLTDDALAPHVRSDSGYPATMTLRRVSIVPGGESVAPRDRGATYGEDLLVDRTAWDGEKPPDGDPTAFEYTLTEAVRDAELLDKPLQDWLAAADTPIIYRATYQAGAGPLDGSRRADWLLSWVDRSDAYYELQIARILPPSSPVPVPSPLPLVGLPLVESSGPAQPPADTNHGWFATELLPERLVPLSEGMRIVRETFGAQELQIFLRSFADPPGYSYFIDGGFEGAGRFTVVYNPETGFIEESTGPVTPRLSS